MASSETTMSYGSSLSYSTTAGGSYTTVGGVKNVKTSFKRPVANVSALEDLEDVFLPKRKTFDPVTADGLFRKTQFAILFAAQQAATKYYWKITFADASTLGPIYGFISGLDVDIPDDEAIMSPFTIQPSSVSGNTTAFTPG